MIDIIDTLEKFDALKDEWERIEQNPDMRIFQTFLWCRNAWDICVSKEKGARLWILRWHQDGKDDVVIFPFYIDGKKTLRFIMDRHSDVCNAVYDERHFNRHWAYKDAAEAICENRAIKSVFLQKMDGSSEALNFLSILIPGSVVSRDNAYSWLTSEKTENFIADQEHFRRDDRHRLKSIIRRADHFDFKILSINSGDAFPEKDVVDIRTSMIGKCREDTSFITNQMIDFVKSIYENGKCELAVLSEGGAPCALAFRLLKGMRITYWIVLYKEARLTTELGLRYMSYKAKTGAWIFDFGVGTYGYKLGTYRPSLAITFSLRFAKSLFRQFLTLAGANIRLLKDMLKPRLKKH